MLETEMELINDFITEEEEKLLISLINLDESKWLRFFSDRKSQAYGFRYIKGEKNSLIKVEDIPVDYNFLIEKLKIITGVTFNQMTVNQYLPGQGIDPHYDHKTIFGNHIAGLTLGSGCNFIFTNKATRKHLTFYLPPRSLYIMKDELRYNWMHKIQRVKTDIVNGEPIKRGVRWSLTFRTGLLPSHAHTNPI